MKRFDIDIDARTLPNEKQPDIAEPERITLRLDGGRVVALPLGDLIRSESVIDATGGGLARLTRLEVETRAIHRVSMIPVGDGIEAETHLMTSASPKIIPHSSRLRVVANESNFRPGLAAAQTIVMEAV